MLNVDINNIEDLKEAGYKAVYEALGAEGFARFIQFVKNGGDYTAEKYYMPQPTLDEIKQAVQS